MISGPLYKELSDIISLLKENKDENENLINSYYESVENLPNDNYNSDSLKKSSNNFVNLILSKDIKLNNDLLKYVDIMNKNVLRHYSDINDFLNEKNIEVKNSFSILCNELGYVIDNENVEN